MKILYFHQHFSTPEGSTGTRSYEMAKKLIKKGHEVTIVCGSNRLSSTGLKKIFKKNIRKGNIEGMDIIEINLPYSNYNSLFKRAILFIRFALKGTLIALKEDYDLLFATSTPLTIGIPGIISKKLRKKPFIFEVRDLWPELPREMGLIKNKLILKLMDWLETLSYKSADHCIALSPGMFEGIAKKGIPKDKITMIPNGSDLDLFKPSNKTRNKTEKIKAVFIGAHGIANGLDYVLDSAEHLIKKNNKDIKIYFIGDGKEKPRLKKEAEKRKLKNCIFLNPLSKTELAKKMKEVDIGLMILKNVPAFYNGTSPNKFFDYLSSGIPIIVNYPGWMTRIIRENNCGIYASPKNPEELSSILLKLSKNSDLRLMMGRNSRKLAEKKFSRDKLSNLFVKKIEETYDKQRHNNKKS